MTTTAVIAEYNPFHNGHAYQLQKARQLTGADALIVIMSGDFVQRGEPAITDKYTRAQSALANGADLVLELPVCYACGSAEYFAKGAISLLNRLGCVDHLCFGSESGDLSFLESIAQILLFEPKEYKQSLKQALKQGNSYPAARKTALEDYLRSHSTDCSGTDTDLSILDTPNNILAIEYLKELKRSHSTIRPVTLKRIGTAYHDTRLDEAVRTPSSTEDPLFLSSASAIRTALKNTENASALASLSKHMPESAFLLLNAGFGRSLPVWADDFSGCLHYQLLSACHEAASGVSSFSCYLDVTENFSDRLQNNLYRSDSFSSLCERLKTKEITYTRISRNLLHILLHLKQDDVEEYLQKGITFYARILGLNRGNQALTKALKSNTSIPLISSPAKAISLLDQTGQKQFRSDLFASDFYESIVAEKFHTTPKNEFERKLFTCLS